MWLTLRLSSRYTPGMPNADAKPIYEDETARAASINFRCESSISDMNRVTDYRVLCEIVFYVCGLKITI